MKCVAAISMWKKLHCLFTVTSVLACDSGSANKIVALDGGAISNKDTVSMDLPAPPDTAPTDTSLSHWDTLPDRQYDVGILVSDTEMTDTSKSTDTSDKTPYHGLTQPMCVWNQAYQENYAPDSVTEILAGSRGCYVLLDPFDSTEARTAIATIKQNKNIVSCYISVGTCEDWRDDYAAIKPYCVSKAWGQWAGEYFVDRTELGLVDQMKARIDKMAAWGCQMVEFDNMDWAFDSENRSNYGITATAAQGETYNQALCTHVHNKGMGCMAKSSAQGAIDFDGLTVESSREDMDWWQPAHMKTMLETGKIGIVVHYNETDCAGVRTTYQGKYNTKLSFICEDRALKKYRHFP